MNFRDLINNLMTEPSIYLGGSRNKFSGEDYKHLITNSTDWDFSCANTVENRKLAEWLGFELATEQMSSEYKDDTAEYYVKHTEYNYITLWFRKDFEAYKKAFDSISVEFYKDHLWKSNPDKLNFSAIYVAELIDVLVKIAKENGVQLTDNWKYLESEEDEDDEDDIPF